MLPYTTVLPKPPLPVGERPILAILLEQLSPSGVKRIDLCVGYLGELIRAYLLETPLRLGGAEVVFHTESEPLGTAGALHEIPALDEPFLSLNGDVLTSLAFHALMDDHRASGAALTVAVQVKQTEIGSGVIELDGPESSPIQRGRSSNMSSALASMRSIRVPLRIYPRDVSTFQHS